MPAAPIDIQIHNVLSVTRNVRSFTVPRPFTVTYLHVETTDGVSARIMLFGDAEVPVVDATEGFR